jgi:hypothetical protein
MILNRRVRCSTPKGFKFAESFLKKANAPLFVLVDTFLGFAQHPFDNWQAITCSFSAKFSANLGNVSPSRGDGIKNSKNNTAYNLVFKALGKFQSFWSSVPKKLLIQYNIKGRPRKLMISGASGPSPYPDQNRLK